MSDDEEKRSLNIPSVSGANEETLKAHHLLNLTDHMTMMADTVSNMAVVIKELSERVKDVAVRIGYEERRRRRDRIVFSFCMAVVAFTGFFGWQVVQSNRSQLVILRSFISPEARKQQVESLQNALLQVRCENEASHRVVLKELKKDHPAIVIPEIDPSCQLKEGD